MIKTLLSKEKQDEIQQAPHGSGRSMSSASAGGGEPGIGSRRRSPATLVTRCPYRLTPPPAGQPGHGSTAHLRRQPVRIVDGRLECGYTDAWELICPYCGDHLDLDYSEVSWRLQWLRGPHLLEAGLAAFHIHLGLT